MEMQRNMETYHCRLTPAMKKALLKQAALELRTANKVVEDAIKIYLGLSESERKTLLKGEKNLLS